VIEYFLVKMSFPPFPGSIKQVNRTLDVGVDEFERIGDGPVNVRLSGQMDDAVEPVFMEQSIHLLQVGDIGPDKLIIGQMFYIREVFEVSGISELIGIDDEIVGIPVREQPDNMRSDKACPAGNE
jgi:hypothetical protein